MEQEITFGWVFRKGFLEEACLSNPGREKERRPSRWEKSTNSEIKWHTGLEKGSGLRYSRIVGRKKRVRVSV